MSCTSDPLHDSPIASARARVRRTLFLAVALAAALPAVAQEPIWVNAFGTQVEDELSVSAADGRGGVIVGGITKGDLGGANAGTYDVWFASIDASGQRRWVRQIGTPMSDRVWTMAPDAAGGAFACGSTLGDLAGPSHGLVDAWIARLDDRGRTLWSRQIGTAEYDYATGLAQDGSGGVYLTGATPGDLYGPNLGSSDAYLTRYDAAGVAQWSIQFGSPESDFPDAAAPSPDGGVYVTGHTDGDLGAPNAGGPDVFLMRFDGSGSLLWTRQFGTHLTDGPHAAAPDGAGGVYVAGHTLGDLGGPLVGLYDAWVARFDGAGKRLWLRQFGEPTLRNVPQALVAAPAGGVLVVGSSHLTPAYSHPWLTRFDALGNQQWYTEPAFGHGLNVWGETATPDGSGGLFVGGRLARTGTGTLAAQAWLGRYALD